MYSSGQANQMVYIQLNRVTNREIFCVFEEKNTSRILQQSCMALRMKLETKNSQFFTF